MENESCALPLQYEVEKEPNGEGKLEKCILTQAACKPKAQLHEQ